MIKLSIFSRCFPSQDPQNPRYWPRRIQQCSHERNYNSENWLASNPEASARTILSYPVWWDTTEQYLLIIDNNQKPPHKEDTEKVSIFLRDLKK